ncbi:MAG: hypothetical protein WD078_07460 [Woeseia sp.]
MTRRADGVVCHLKYQLANGCAKFLFDDGGGDLGVFDSIVE